MPNRRGRGDNRGTGIFVVALAAAMVIVVVATASTLDRKAQLVAAGAAVMGSQKDWARALKTYTTLITIRVPLRIPAQWPAPWYM